MRSNFEVLSFAFCAPTFEVLRASINIAALLCKHDYQCPASISSTACVCTVHETCNVERRVNEEYRALV